MQFATAARVLADTARSLRLTAPSFRSPPRLQADRTIRGSGTPSATVSVRVKGRPWLAVLADLVEGVVVTNRLTGASADRCRTELWSTIEQARLAELPARERAQVEPVRSTATARGATGTVGATPGWRKRQTQAA